MALPVTSKEIKILLFHYFLPQKNVDLNKLENLRTFKCFYQSYVTCTISFDIEKVIKRVCPRL